MILFKTKNILVSCGQDSMLQIVCTTENGRSFGMPIDMFKSIFEPENDDANDWLKAIENRYGPPITEYEAAIIKDENGEVTGFKTKSK